MIYIDKSTYRPDFDIYSKAYLKDHCRQNGTIFPPLANDITYDKFAKKCYKDTPIPPTSPIRGWKQVLLEEQKGMCCFCMKNLRDDAVSFEHLIPRNPNPTDYGYYTGHIPWLSAYVELGSAFDNRIFNNSAEIDALTIFPHMVAHSNLFACCINSTKDREVGCSCNNNRQRDHILPFWLMPQCDACVKFKTDGTLQMLYSDINEVMNTMKSLDLNTDTLKCIRKMWYLASRKYNKCKDVRKIKLEDRVKFLLHILDLQSVEEIPVEYLKFSKFDDDAYWKLFLRYGWFLGYYLTAYPLPNP